MNKGRRGEGTNPQYVFGANDARYDNIATTIDPPQPDVGYGGNRGTSSTFNENGQKGTNESMMYRAYYGDLNTSMFAPLDKRGYSKVNMSNEDSGGGIWSDTNVLTNVPNSKKRKKGNKYAGGAYDDDDDDDDDDDMAEEFTDRDMSRSKVASGKGDKKASLSSNKGGNSSWMQTNDPFGGGRSYLLRELKSKFIHLTTPLTKFVTRYLALSGNGDESSIHDLIKVRQVFDKAQVNNDWEGLVKTLYGKGGMEEGDMDTSELINTLIHMVKQDALAAKTTNNDDDDDDEDESDSDIRKANNILNTHEDTKKQTAQMLRDSYYNMVSGKVVFLLDPILRESAQALLDTINEQFRGTYKKPDFQLLEVMKSGSVMTVFIQLMLLKKQTTNMLGTTPINPSVLGSGMYGTLADRVSSGSARYQNQNYGSGGRSNYTIVQSRPTVANMVAGSLEYANGMEYFRTVEKASDGSGGLVKLTKQNWEKQVWEASYKSRHNVDSESNFTYDRKTGVYVNNRKYNFSRKGLGNRRGKWYGNKPVETIQSAVNRMRSGRYVDNGMYNDRVVSYRSMDGSLKLINRDVLNDNRALANFYNTGKPGRYGVDFEKTNDDYDDDDDDDDDDELMV